MVRNKLTVGHMLRAKISKLIGLSLEAESKPFMVTYYGDIT